MTKRAVLLLLLLAVANGCAHEGPSQALTETDPTLASQAHWLAQPAAAEVSSDNYDALWQACTQTARWRQFKIDRTDYRNGILTTLPLESKQFFELWRRDVVDIHSIAESSLLSTRRLVRFEIAKTDESGTSFRCVPKVLVERYSSSEKRITSVTRYRESFDIEPNQGSRERDKGVNIPETYWYTVGRDAALERKLAEGVESRLRSMASK